MESGNLAQKGVLSLLSELSQNRATGSLKLERAPLQKAVYFRDGQILFAASNDPKDQLSSILVEEGKLGPDQMQIAQARVSPGNPLAKVLTELGYISQRELAEAARLKVEKILTDLFAWKDGSYQFAEKSLPKGAIDLELSTSRLMFNSIRRMQDREWVLKELGSLDTVLLPSHEFDDFLRETEPDDKAQDVLRLADGVKSVKQIASLSSLSEFEVCKILAASVLLGAIRKGIGEAAEAAPVGPPVPAREDILSLSADDMLPEGSDLPGGEPEPMEKTILDTEARPFEGLEGEPAPLPPQPSLVEPPPVPTEPTPPPPSTPSPSIPSPPIQSPEPSSLLIDEAESEPVDEEPLVQRVPPRPRHMGRAAGGRMSNKILVAAAGLVLLIGGGAAGYYFLWPMFAGGQPSPTTAPKTKQPAPGKRLNQKPQVTPPKGVPKQPSKTAGIEPKAKGKEPTTVSPAAPGKKAGQKPPAITAKQPSATASKPPSKSPTTPRPSPTTSDASLARGQELLRNGKIPEAAAVFLQHIRSTAADKYTIAVGVYCEANNVARAYKNSGNSERLLIFPYTLKGRSCYRVFWGLFDSQESAQRSVASVPSAIRSPDSIPVPVSRLIR